MIEALKRRLRTAVRGMALRPEIVVRNEFVRGENVKIGEGVRIYADNLYLGDGVTIEPGVVIDSQDLFIGDYTKIKRHAFISGTDWCYLGANCWVGNFTIIDSIGTTFAGNNIAFGANSQIWSHIKFGDVLKGCRFETRRPLRIGDDAWFVAHCIVSPVSVEERSMAMVGALITKDMKANHVYGGAPAVDLTDKLGYQFEPTSVEERKERMAGYLEEFYALHPSFRGAIQVVEAIDGAGIQFDVARMEYSKTLEAAEVALMEFLLPERAKFVPVRERNWVYDRFLDKYGDEV